MAELVPPAATLLEAAAAYLEQELLPTLDGYHRFQTRICVNVVRTVSRELRLAAAHDAAERGRLAALLGHQGETVALNGELIDAIGSGRMALDAPGLFEHLRRTLAEALAIDNPKWTDG